MAAAVQPSSFVEVGARLDDTVVVGPFCHVGPDVELGPGTLLLGHATVLGPSKLGAENRVFPHAVLGAAPQDRSYRGEPTRLVVGDRNEFREQVTVHRGTTKGGGATTIGNGCLLMVGAHVAHDCVLEDDVVLTNLATLGGHVHVEPGAVLGGHVAVAPFVRIGRLSFVAGGARVERDVPPFTIVAGDRARVRAINRVGLVRAGVPEPSRLALKRAFRILWRSGQPLASALGVADSELSADPWVAQLLSFLRRSA